jgi:TRAP-type C4-dicarboxylate transport system permease large subunit
MASAMAKIVEGFNAPPQVIILAMLMIYLVLGCVTESMAMVLLNLFVLKAMAQEIPDSDVYKGVLPFVLSDIVRTAIISYGVLRCMPSDLAIRAMSAS